MTDRRPDTRSISYRLEDSAGHLLRRAHQRHAALFLEQAGGIGLTPPQFAALLKLSELGQVTQNRLGRLIAMDSATIKGVVQRLIVRGLVQTGRDPMDRRSLVLTVTGEGLEVLEEVRRAAERSNRALLSPLQDDERALLLRLLRLVGTEARVE